MNAIIYNILLNQDIKDIKNICLISKHSMKIGTDKHFWKEKFAYDNIGLLQHVNLPVTLIDWINEYKICKKSIYDAKFILMVNHIELTRNRPSNGEIVIKFVNTTFDELIWLYLPKKLLINTTPTTVINNISLTILQLDKDYQIKLKQYWMMNNIYNECIMEKDDVVKLLTKIVYSYHKNMVFKIYSGLIWEDIGFLDLDYDYINVTYKIASFARDVALQRLGIRDTLLFLDNP